MSRNVPMECDCPGADMKMAVKATVRIHQPRCMPPSAASLESVTAALEEDMCVAIVVEAGC